MPFAKNAIRNGSGHRDGSHFWCGHQERAVFGSCFWAEFNLRVLFCDPALVVTVARRGTEACAETLWKLCQREEKSEGRNFMLTGYIHRQVHLVLYSEQDYLLA